MIPASDAARFVAAIWSVLNLAGIVMIADATFSSEINDFSVFNTSADNSSEENPRSIKELSYEVSSPIVRLNSIKTFSLPLFQDLVALDLSERKSLYAPSPIREIFFFVYDTQDGKVSFRVSVFLMTGSPFSILHIAELVVPRSIPYLIFTCTIYLPPIYFD